MAQIESGGGRSANTEVNLVPFIDLMSVLITFLLITAVWSQVSMIQLGSSMHGKQTDSTPPPPQVVSDIALRLDVKDQGFRLIVGTENHMIPKVGGNYDREKLLAELAQVKSKYPEKDDAVITVDDTVPYEFMILGMDTLLHAKFKAISVATGESP